MSADDRPRRRRRLSDEERSLWGQVIRSVVPLRGRSLLAEEAPAAIVLSDKPKPVRRAQRRAPAAAPKPAASPSLEPLDRRQKQRLARGTVPIDARLDLHGRTQSEAHSALERFLRRAQAAGARFVLVITGKGARPDNRDRAADRGTEPWGERGVLRRQVPLWLRLPEFRPYVVGFEEAHGGHGGAGAFYVRVRRPRTAR